MIGRQFCTLNPQELQGMLAEFGAEPDDHVLSASNAYAEPLLRFLGAQEIVSLDANSYQGASMLHDMNLPIPPGVKGRFDVVIEGGSLEHIFNFPVAVQNCMEMLTPGGSFLGISSANNFCGHGFYQFSPDLFFRIFSARNGFIVKRIILSEVMADAEWFEVADPLTAGQFVETMGGTRPTYVLVHAKKLEERLIFSEFPEQSVYTMLWNGKCPEADGSRLIFPTSRVMNGESVQNVGPGTVRRSWGFGVAVRELVARTLKKHRFAGPRSFDR
jgi:SAM-dependent methyltransferase